MSIKIHPSACVDKQAELADGVEIGPFCVVGAGVRLGENVRLVSQVNVTGHVDIGQESVLHPFVSIGQPPQDRKHKGGKVSVYIGARNVFREQVTVHSGSDCAHRKTVIGDDNLFMVGCHIAHDCHIGNHVCMANYVQIAGHVVIENYVTFGGVCAVHQDTNIGAYAFIGGTATVLGHVIPYGMVVGNPAYLVGLNIVGLKRHDFAPENIRVLRAAYRLLFSEEGKFSERIADSKRLYCDDSLVMNIINFIHKQNKRSLVMPRKSYNNNI